MIGFTHRQRVGVRVAGVVGDLESRAALSSLICREEIFGDGDGRAIDCDVIGKSFAISQGDVAAEGEVVGSLRAIIERVAGVGRACRRVRAHDEAVLIGARALINFVGESCICVVCAAVGELVAESNRVGRCGSCRVDNFNISVGSQIEEIGVAERDGVAVVFVALSESDGACPSPSFCRIDDVALEGYRRAGRDVFDGFGVVV